MNLFLPPLKFSEAHFECNIASKVLQHPVMGSKCFCMPLVLIIFSCKIVVNLSVHILDFNFILLSLEMQKNTPRCKKIRLICLGAEKGFNGKKTHVEVFLHFNLSEHEISAYAFTHIVRTLFFIRKIMSSLVTLMLVMLCTTLLQLHHQSSCWKSQDFNL